MAPALPRKLDEREGVVIDTVSSGIRAVEFNSGREVGDSPMLPDLLDQIPEHQKIGTVTGDGPFDTPRCHAAIRARWHSGSGIPTDWWQSCPCFHPQKRPHLESGLPRRSRTIWKKWSGQHDSSRINARMRNLKCLHEPIASRDPPARRPRSTSAWPR